MVSECPLTSQPLPECRPVLAGQAHTRFALPGLALQDSLQALLCLLEALQLRHKHTATTDASQPACVGARQVGQTSAGLLQIPGMAPSAAQAADIARVEPHHDAPKPLHNSCSSWVLVVHLRKMNTNRPCHNDSYSPA